MAYSPYMTCFPIPSDQFHDQVFGLGRGGGDDLCAKRWVAVYLQTDSEHDHVPGFLEVVPCGQLVEPGSVPLATTETLGLRCRDALDEGPIDQPEFVQALVVVGDQDFGDHGQQARVALEACAADVTARWG